MITRDVYDRAQHMRSRGFTAAEVSRSLGISRSAAYKIGKGTYSLAQREQSERDELRRQRETRERAQRDAANRPLSLTETSNTSRASQLPTAQHDTLTTNLGDVLPLRLANYLETRDIFCLGDVLQRTCEQLLAIPGIGLKSLGLILAVLDRQGFDTAYAWQSLEKLSVAADN